ncbi:MULTISPECIES: hypothetical protein [Bradyrhizobium]|uniref:Uncharacterized protein n=1 Tax=Bradyrhizobium septentrionale TaxID=1404411 RepID=A0A973W731_9BRAD|nr:MULTISPECIES: hypothetical protein [Bradyrhizobium]MCK7672945.1 hypothetical protein [Bradyrhizobium sp. 2S1]QIG94543.1 hypothetical protein G6P99_20340 [Bradyrhizobium sp. 6(2017)]UGY17053.1 hypothetical protein HAP48_0006325 [Bradyrhizobium septentrionale]UGY25797.1 hypothetical protein HU675_0003055 [Bradyrhizobium septentrionale]
MAQHESIEISQPNCSSLRWSELLALLLTHYTLERLHRIQHPRGTPPACLEGRETHARLARRSSLYLCRAIDLLEFGEIDPIDSSK